jgi:hypothetical protein
VAPLIGEAIKRIHRGESVGALFSSEVSFTQEMLLWEDGVARKLDLRTEPADSSEASGREGESEPRRDAGKEGADDDEAVGVSAYAAASDIADR